MNFRFGTATRGSEASALLQFAVGASFLVAWVLAFSALLALLPGVAILVCFIIASIIAYCVSGFLGKTVIRIENAKRELEAKSYRDMREAEVQKKIDEMREKNSNVPRVTR